MQTVGSARFHLNGRDLAAIVRGALLAGGGAMIAFLSTEVLPQIDNSTLLGAAIAGIGSTLLNGLRKYLSDTR